MSNAGIRQTIFGLYDKLKLYEVYSKFDGSYNGTQKIYEQYALLLNFHENSKNPLKNNNIRLFHIA